MHLVSYESEGEEYVVVKYIQKSDRENCIRLVSYNQHHSPQDIPITKIRAIALVKASVRYNTMK
ncbi:S24 family peptidase [Alistipes sp. OttesenSCG-928-L06]|nr:S24 family peptidase [Alistipes sp. OttesenSCG-928-L06]